MVVELVVQYSPSSVRYSYAQCGCCEGCCAVRDGSAETLDIVLLIPLSPT